MIVRADYVQTEQRLKELSECAIKLMRVAERLEEVTEDLGIFWDSEASEQYALNMAADIFSIRTLAEQVNITLKGAFDALLRLDAAEIKVGELINGP